jgi:type III pantothenate kinase
MKLVIDIGNTFCKIAVFEKDRMLLKKEMSTPCAQTIINEVSKHAISHCLISDVQAFDKNFYKEINEAFPIINWSFKNLPISLDYDSPETLGSDRVAAVIGAKEEFPKQNILLIQCGSCITYEYLSAEGIYQGGAISPGIEIRFKALHTFTGKLPLLNIEDVPTVLGKTTKESILSGVLLGIVKEVDSMIEEFKQQINKSLSVVLTGGHAFFFDKYLKNSKFAVSNLVLIGLNKILDYYIENDKKHIDN